MNMLTVIDGIPFHWQAEGVLSLGEGEPLFDAVQDKLSAILSDCGYIIAPLPGGLVPKYFR